jgi:chromate transporter
MQEPCGSPAHAAARSGSTADVFAAILRLGLASFGGPIARLGCFQEEFVVRRKWLKKAYVDLVALPQFLPGPASGKIGIALVAIARRLCGGAGRRGWSSRSARSAARR